MGRRSASNWASMQYGMYGLRNVSASLPIRKTGQYVIILSSIKQLEASHHPAGATLKELEILVKQHPELNVKGLYDKVWTAVSCGLVKSSASQAAAVQDARGSERTFYLTEKGQKFVTTHGSTLESMLPA